MRAQRAYTVGARPTLGPAEIVSQGGCLPSLRAFMAARACSVAGMTPPWHRLARVHLRHLHLRRCSGSAASGSAASGTAASGTALRSPRLQSPRLQSPRLAYQAAVLANDLQEDAHQRVEGVV
eukprot:scaffold72126_cov71-Phaeocystis_antarctica.AAC.3